MTARKKESVTAITEAPAPRGDKSIIRSMAQKYGMDQVAFQQVLMKTVMKSSATKEQVGAFLMICNKYDLDPFASEVYAYPDRGGIKAMVGVDGFIAIANRNPQFDGMDHKDNFDKDGNLLSITCSVYRKDRSRPATATEYMSENYNPNSPVWKKYKSRMLRHRATVQAIRLAFGVSGIAEKSEIEDYQQTADATPTIDFNKVIDQQSGDKQ